VATKYLTANYKHSVQPAHESMQMCVDTACVHAHRADAERAMQQAAAQEARVAAAEAAKRAAQEAATRKMLQGLSMQVRGRGGYSTGTL
jgi:membrane protein involved in colicin uptake